MRDILALCELFVLRSVNEHFGRVGETRRLAPPEEPRALAATVHAPFDDPASASRLGAAGRWRADSTFGLASHVEAIECIYRPVLGANRAR